MQGVALCGEGIVLAGGYIGFLELRYLEGEQVDAAQALCLVGIGGVQLSLNGFELAVDRAVSRELRPDIGESVDVDDVQRRIHQLEIIVLPVDVDEVFAQLPKRRYGSRTGVDTAGVFARCVELAGQDKRVVLGFVAHGSQLFESQLGQALKGRADESGVRAGADHTTRRAVTEHGVDRVDDDAFTGAGLTREDVEPAGEVDPAFFDNRYILDVKIR